MKIQNQNTPIETNTSSPTSFKIKNSSAAFRILSDGLYSDKILAVIRELCCNAWDAHKEAGIPDQPFVVTLPNSLEPHFSVKDHGVGLCHDDVLHLYTTYFESTKTDSNDFIGALGLGSKSPFSYVDKFSVISIFNGQKSFYTSYIDANGAPNIVRMGDPEKTDESNGIEVTFPVKTSDISTFTHKAIIALRFFKVQPIIKGALNYAQAQHTYQREEPSWKIFKGNTYSYAVQGNVGYPLDIESIKNFLSPEELLVAWLPLELEFPIGKLQPTASREGLSYETNTVANIKILLKEIYDTLILEAGDFFKDCKTEYEARLLFNNTFGSNLNFSRNTGHIHTLQEFHKRCVTGGMLKLEWNGKKIESNFMSFDPDQYPHLEFDINFSGKKRSFKSLSDPEVKAEMSRNHKIPGIAISTYPHKVYFDDLPKSGSTRLRENLTRYTQAVFVKPVRAGKTKVSDAEMALAKTEFDEFITHMDGQPFEVTSSIQVSAKEAIIKSDSYELMKWQGYQHNRSYGSSCWKKIKTSSIDKNDIKYYVPVYEYGVVRDLNFVGPANAETRKIKYLDCIIAAICHRPDLFVIKDLKNVYGLRKKDLSIVKDDPSWVNLFDHIGKISSDKKNVINFGKEMSYYRDFNFLDDNKKFVSNFTDFAMTSSLPEGELKVMITRIDDIVTMKRQNLLTNSVLSGFKIISGIYKWSQKDIHAKSLIELRADVLNKYPMLVFIERSMDSTLTPVYATLISQYVNMVEKEHSQKSVV